jgi:hypothetical protein
VTDESRPEDLCLYLQELGLPEDFCDRDLPSSESQQFQRIIASYEDWLGRSRPRTFLTALLLASIGVAEDLLTCEGLSSIADAFEKYPPAEIDSNGNPVNTLTLLVGEEPIGLRGYYNRVEGVVHGSLNRQYPNMAPHATQAWSQHRDEIETIFSLNPAERYALAMVLWQKLLDRPILRVEAGLTPNPRRFSYAIDHFNTAPEEPPGVVLQALTYGYFVVDLGHLLVIESGKAGAGGSRSQRVGDVDGWSGANLSFSVEVKDKDITERNVRSELGHWFGALSQYPDATAIAMTRTITPGAQEILTAQSILWMDRDALAQSVRMWPPEKQDAAIRAIETYFLRIQRRIDVLTRFQEVMRGSTADQEHPAPETMDR